MPRRNPKPRRRRRSLAVEREVGAPVVSGAATKAGPYDTYAYWLMPHGLRGLLTTVFWPTATAGRARRERAASLPFPLLAPAKNGRAVGEHAFWRGPLWGRTVALQGDASFTKFDLFELAGPQLLYWGSFRGNGYYGSEESHSFEAPFVWLDRFMNVGDIKQQPVSDTVLDPRHRKATNSDDHVLRVEIVAHYDAWRDPDSGIAYEDVLELHYWGRYPDPMSREVYHLGFGLGTIRFESMNPLEPSGVHYQYAELFERFTPPELPALPWYDPFHSATHVRNGYCEDFLLAPEQGGAVARYLRGWSGTSDAVITTDGGDQGASPWKIALRGTSGGGDGTADFVIASDWIPVTPGRRYRLSGSLWRVSADDNVYLDFNDGVGQGGSFEDAQALARHTEVWERVAAEATVGPTTTAIKVRCVRDGANRGNAYVDGITLQRVD
jgi:hypothetical protein